MNGVREQEVEIYLNFIGKFDLPEQEETPVRKNRKKRRHEMTEEQRTAILKGTAYEIRPQEAGAAHAAI